MSKFTQGPWIIHNGGQSEFYIKAHDWVIAETCKPHPMMNSTEGANAALIAAAPDMYELLEMLGHELIMDDMSGYGESQKIAIEKIGKILAKARGEK